MPLVNIRLARREVPTTAAQKAALIAGVTQLMQQVLDKRPESVTVIIDEVDLQNLFEAFSGTPKMPQTGSRNWGQGGEPVTEIRRRSQGPTQA